MPKMPILLSKRSPKSQQKKGDLMLTTLILLLDFQAITFLHPQWYCPENLTLTGFELSPYLSANHDRVFAE